MADAPDPIAELAVGLNEDAKAKRKKAGGAGNAPAADGATTQDAARSDVSDTSSTPIAEQTQPEVADEIGGPREVNHLAAMEELEDIAEELNIPAAQITSMVAFVRDAMAEVFKHRQKPWGDLLASEQRDVLTTLEYGAKAMVRKCVIALAEEGRPSIRCKLEGYGEKDGIKINLSLGAMTPTEQETAIVLLHRATKKEVLIITADSDTYDRPLAKPKTEPQPDQPEIEFTPPPGDTDLAGEEEIAVGED